MAKHATNKNRNRRMKEKRTYTKLREKFQLDGTIETTPEGAIKDEVVDPSTQSEGRSERQLAPLVQRATRNGWATPEEKKQIIVDRLIEPFEKEDYTIDREGNRVPVPPDRNLLKENARVLGMLDKTQYERDNPKNGENGTGVSVNIQNINEQKNVIVDPYQMFKKLIEDGEGEEG